MWLLIWDWEERADAALITYDATNSFGRVIDAFHWQGA